MNQRYRGNHLSTNEPELQASFSYKSIPGVFLPKDYVSGSIMRRWPDLFDSPVHEVSFGQTYEDKIRSFLLTSDRSYPVLLIVGGIGCGKTSTAIHSMQTVSLCKKCSPKQCSIGVIDVYIDCRDIEEPSMRPVWGRIEKGLNDTASRHIKDEGSDLVEFWQWANSSAGKELNFVSRFRDYLCAVSGDIRRGIVSTIERAWSDFWLRLDDNTTDTKCKYRVLQLSYVAGKKHRQSCNVIWIDNIDQLNPAQQTEIVRFANDCARSFPCRVIIPIRPYTLGRGVFATSLTSYLIHSSPLVTDVIKKRIDNFLEKANERMDIFRILMSFELRLSEDKRLRDVITWSSGDSVRFTIRNVHNLLVSDSLTIEPGQSDAFDRRVIPDHTLYEAYFCGQDRRLNRGAFDNIFDVKGFTHQMRHIVKLWILRLLHRTDGNSVHVSELRSYMKGVLGFRDGLIVGAMNEMMTKKRPLLWSNKTHEFTIEEFKSDDSKHMLYLSTLGFYYFTYLIDDIYFYRECVYDIFRKRSPNEKGKLSVWPILAFNFLVDLESISTRCTDRVRRNFGEDAESFLFDKKYNLRSWVTRMKPRLAKLARKQGVILR